MVKFAQAIVNRLLALDPEVQNEFVRFQNNVINVNVIDFDQNVFVNITNNGIEILNAYEGEVKASIKGTSVAIAQLGVQQVFPNLSSTNSVSIEGDLEFMQQILQLSKKYYFDWEALLAKAFGDVVGHQLGNGLREFASWVSGAATNTREDVSEFLHEEVQVVPTPQELKKFADDVDELRDDIERISVRVNRLVGDQ